MHACLACLPPSRLCHLLPPGAAEVLAKAARVVCFDTNPHPTAQEPFVAATAAEAGESHAEVPKEVRINSVHQDQVRQLPHELE